ncbi:hypothetical protein CVV72_14270 [Amycolatopsis sp. TNS106]|nr:hypothetical protein CVV72_14270 [Amycolatopsis sp. TNS106]
MAPWAFFGDGLGASAIGRGSGTGQCRQAAVGCVAPSIELWPFFGDVARRVAFLLALQGVVVFRRRLVPVASARVCGVGGR